MWRRTEAFGAVAPGPSLAVRGGAFPGSAWSSSSSRVRQRAMAGGCTHSLASSPRVPVLRAAVGCRPRWLKRPHVPRPPPALGVALGSLCADISAQDGSLLPALLRSARGSVAGGGCPANPSCRPGSSSQLHRPARTVNSSLSSAQIGKD